ncbi:PucR family transcriptional regulator [Paenibacillus radicis (ex Gao et al. 2016)]|uniref:Purine catabolism regulatory protein n=1 Tax=Paenibacillus radicis (ex Gao et al. 2016) TaxID=1737354 RepID=A0A917HHS1_9BACL|nr:PucR family transcriptional regulator [Paenibacillus radicis (ex Gao et al. 2016)]GGG79737.1 purine catabolism regulatory protein [Paenibacillus radicis (ex Gao et al. 2016)]
MHLTVEQALAVYPLSEGKLVAGTAGRSRIVKSVNVMDAPDITDWIKEGEMLFTTAYFIKDQPQEAAELICRLNQRGSSALGIKLGRFWDAIPDNLIARANELGFPLIELPYAFTFSDQMNGLFREEMKRNTGVLQDVLDKQIRLMRFALKTENMSELFHAVEDIIGYPVAVAGSRGQMVHNGTELDDRELLESWPWPQQQKWMKSERWQAYRIPLMKNSRCTGFVLFFNPQLFLSTPEESLYLQASELLSYHMNMKYEDFFELSAQKDFGVIIKRYLQNGLPIDTVTDYADRWEIDLLRQSYSCVLTNWTASSGAETGRLDRLKSDYLSHSRLQRLNGLHIVMEEGLLSVLPHEGITEEEIDASIGACFATHFRDASEMPRAAISRKKKKTEQLLEAFEECRQTLRLAGEWKAQQRIVRFETMDLALLFEHVSKERMEAFCNRWLGGVLNKAPDYAGEMLRTLEAYLDNDGQLNETAKKLFIHRNTATYRIEKLSEILNVDLKKMNDLLRLKIAFMFRRLLNKDHA